ncbi:MAG: hypothetical protein HY271_15240 [Deltaproteobacteria bacterium]|nr:hypothetical protein [Deltaproteobacteria bacterium]
MRRLSCHIRRLRAGIALALLAAMLAAPAVALADRDGGNRDDARGVNLSCTDRETLVRVDEAVCPPNSHRPLFIRKRKCCMNPQSKMHCDHFDHCPNESPS